MNVIRTKVVELTTIPAIAYKMKLASGGAGIKVLRIDSDKTAVCTVDKRSSDLVPYGSYDAGLFPPEAFYEAQELTEGLPYSARGSIKVTPQEPVEEEVENTPADTAEPINVVALPEYQSLVERYSDETGKINYVLMNKDFIQFASRSKIVSEMIQAKASPDDIVLFIVKSRVTMLANQKTSLEDTTVKLLMEVFDEIDPRSAFKELKAHVIRLLARQSRSK